MRTTGGSNGPWKRGEGRGTRTGKLRSESVEPGIRRAHFTSFTVDDGYGGSCSAELLVSVPGDQDSGGAAVDDGAILRLDRGIN